MYKQFCMRKASKFQKLLKRAELKFIFKNKVVVSKNTEFYAMFKRRKCSKSSPKKVLKCNKNGINGFFLRFLFIIFLVNFLATFSLDFYVVSNSACFDTPNEFF